MSFFDDALHVFETATHNIDPSDLGILIDDRGAVRVVSAEGWRPEALQAHYGARTVFQVTRTPASVRVEARSGHRSATLRSEMPAGLLAPVPDWQDRHGVTVFRT